MAGALSTKKAGDRPLLLVFSDDWGRHPSSCQHLVSQLLDRYRVVWVNTIGMRTPSIDFATLKRGTEKLLQWFQGRKAAAKLPEGLTILNPRMWPWFTRPRDRKLNRYLLKRALQGIVSATAPTTAITTIPIVADLVGELDIGRWVYYCVDDFSVWPGLDQQTLRAMETKLIERVDSIVAVSDTLRDRIQSAGRSSDLLTHGVDIDFWRQGRNTQLPLSVGELQRPLITFWGVIDRRMDTSFVRHLAGHLSGGTILLVGPTQDPDPELLSLPHVQLLPPMAFDDLPALAKSSSVLIMPYVDADVTRAMQPLKLKEYLATGKPVVVRDLPSTQAWQHCLDLARTPNEFSQLVRTRLEEGLAEAQLQSRACLSCESWAAKARQFERLAQLSINKEPAG